MATKDANGALHDEEGKFTGNGGGGGAKKATDKSEASKKTPKTNEQKRAELEKIYNTGEDEKDRIATSHPSDLKKMSNRELVKAFISTSYQPDKNVYIDDNHPQKHPEQFKRDTKLREKVMDELERRDPEAFDKWMDEMYDIALTKYFK